MSGLHLARVFDPEISLKKENHCPQTGKATNSRNGQTKSVPERGKSGSHKDVMQSIDERDMRDEIKLKIEQEERNERREKR